MRQFPNTPEYTGLNTPLGEEYEIGSLAVEGRIPPDVEGVFFRAVPDPAFPPFVEDGGAILSGDGMVSAVRFAGGKAALRSATFRPRATRRRWRRGARCSASTAIHTPTSLTQRASTARSPTPRPSGTPGAC